MDFHPLGARTLVASVGVMLVATACSSGATSPSNKSAASASVSLPGPSIARGSGPVNVLYAGSLVNVMDKQLGPAFNTVTGYTFTGFSAGSTALAAQIKGKVHAGDVFISASPDVNTSLEGPANGNWVSWYAIFASSPLVIGFNPSSKFAADLQSKPWYDVVTQPGFLLGSTDPATDPKGKLAAQAITAQTASTPGLAAVKPASYPEETLVGRLQAGQLDAAFFYSSEAAAANIKTVPVTGQTLKATYTATVLNQAPNEAGAEAFIQYLLGAEGQSTLKEDGFALITPPTVVGTGAPASLHDVLPGK